MNEPHENPAPPGPATLARLRAGFASVPQGSAPSGADPERIWAAVHGAVHPDDDDASRLALLDQLHRDPQLALEWRLAAALGPFPDEHADAVAQLGSKTTQTGRDGSSSFPIAVGVMLAAAAALALWSSSTAPTEPTRSVTRDPAWRAQGPHQVLHTTLGVEHPLARDAFRLQWSSDLEGAASFTVRVTTQDLAAVYEKQALTATSALVPAAALESFPAGTVLLWRVEAVEPDGRRHASRVWEITLE